MEPTASTGLMDSDEGTTPPYYRMRSCGLTYKRQRWTTEHLFASVTEVLASHEPHERGEGQQRKKESGRLVFNPCIWSSVEKMELTPGTRQGVPGSNYRPYLGTYVGRVNLAGLQ